MARVRKTDLAMDSQLHEFVREGDFLDCYSVELEQADPPLQEVAQHLLTDMPCWTRSLLAIRDLAVSPFGLKATSSLPTDAMVRESVAIGESINFFQVHGIDENEIILGEDDSHLDFRIAVRRDRDRPSRISLATWVRTHNPLGVVYLRSITAFHILIVNSSLARLARRYAA